MFLIVLSFVLLLVFTADNIDTLVAIKAHEVLQKLIEMPEQDKELSAKQVELSNEALRLFAAAGGFHKHQSLLQLQLRII